MSEGDFTIERAYSLETRPWDVREKDDFNMKITQYKRWVRSGLE